MTERHYRIAERAGETVRQTMAAVEQSSTGTAWGDEAAREAVALAALALEGLRKALEGPRVPLFEQATGRASRTVNTTIPAEAEP